MATSLTGTRWGLIPRVTSLPAIAGATVALALLLAGCTSARVTGEQTFAPVQAGTATTIYVTDFDLGSRDIAHEDGILSGRPGPLGRVGSRLSGASRDPAARARQLVELMSDSLVKELAKEGFNASRVPPGARYPGTGWLVRGVFTEVQEGNRLRRAMIGFGQGETDLQVVTTIDDLSLGLPKPLYEVATDASSGSAPGAAPTLVISPYGAAARFVIAGKDLDRNVKQTAARIAEQIASRFKQGH